MLEQVHVAQNNLDEMLFLTPDEGLVLHSTINRKLKSIAKKDGIDENISTHCLRHTYRKKMY